MNKRCRAGRRAVLGTATHGDPRVSILGGGGRCERSVILVSSSGAKIASCLDSRAPRWSRELRSPTAASQAVAGCVDRSRRRRGRDARPLAREHRGDVNRRSAAAARDRPWPLCAALARACRAQPGRGLLRGRGAARAHSPSGGGLAAATLAAMARPRGHRLHRDRANGHRVRTREQDPHL